MPGQEIRPNLHRRPQTDRTALDQSRIGLDAESGFPGAVTAMSAIDAGHIPWGGYQAPSPFIDGDPSNVVGLSLPLLRRLLGELGISWTDLWDKAPAAGQ